MKIGELSRRTGVSVRMLRYYEQEGLLQPHRLQSGYREYSEIEAELVRCIGVFKKSGLTLKTIRQLLPCVQIDHAEFQPCPTVMATLKQEIKNIDQQIEDLTSIRRALASHLRAIS